MNDAKESWSEQNQIKHILPKICQHKKNTNIVYAWLLKLMQKKKKLGDGKCQSPSDFVDENFILYGAVLDESWTLSTLII